MNKLLIAIKLILLINIVYLKDINKDTYNEDRKEVLNNEKLAVDKNKHNQSSNDNYKNSDIKKNNNIPKNKNNKNKDNNKELNKSIKDNHGHNHNHNHNHGHKHSHGHSHNHDHPEFLLEFQNKISGYLNNLLDKYPIEYHSYIGAGAVSVVPFPILFIMLIFKIGSSFMFNLLSAFSLGALLGDVLFHNFKEVFNSTDNRLSFYNNLLNELFEKEMFIIYGIIFMIFIEKTISDSHNHNHDNNSKALNNNNNSTNRSEIMIAFINDFVHNFTDGVAIAASFRINKNLGISTVIAIVLHEIPHEVADFSFLLKRGKSTVIALFNQLLAGLGAFLGVYLSKIFI